MLAIVRQRRGEAERDTYTSEGRKEGLRRVVGERVLEELQAVAVAGEEDDSEQGRRADHGGCEREGQWASVTVSRSTVDHFRQSSTIRPLQPHLLYPTTLRETWRVCHGSERDPLHVPHGTVLGAASRRGDCPRPASLVQVSEQHQP